MSLVSKLQSNTRTRHSLLSARNAITWTVQEMRFAEFSRAHATGSKLASARAAIGRSRIWRTTCTPNIRDTRMENMPIGTIVASFVRTKREVHTRRSLYSQAMANSPSHGSPLVSSLSSLSSVPISGAYPQASMACPAMNNAMAAWSGANPNPFAPEMRDPMEYATEVALSQPADKRWRRFQNAMFRVEDVEGFNSEGSGSIAVRLRCPTGFGHVFTLPFRCDDPVQWFAEHVMGFEFPNAKRAT